MPGVAIYCNSHAEELSGSILVRVERGCRSGRSLLDCVAAVIVDASNLREGQMRHVVLRILQVMFTGVANKRFDGRYTVRRHGWQH